MSSNSNAVITMNGIIDSDTGMSIMNAMISAMNSSRINIVSRMIINMSNMMIVMNVKSSVSMFNTSCQLMVLVVIIVLSVCLALVILSLPLSSIPYSDYYYRYYQLSQ